MRKNIVLAIITAVTILYGNTCAAQSQPILPGSSPSVRKVTLAQIYRYAREMYRTGQYPEAIKAFKEMLAVDCNSEIAQYHLMKIARTSPQYADLNTYLKNLPCTLHNFEEEDFLPGSLYYETDVAIMQEQLGYYNKRYRIAKDSLVNAADNYAKLTKELEEEILSLRKQLNTTAATNTAAAKVSTTEPVKPKAPAPKATTTETAKPKVTAPKTAAVAKTPASEVATPKATTTETAKPKVTAPETAAVTKAPAPEVATPKATTTETAKPKVTAPETAAVAKAPAPEVAIPKATTTETAKPKVTAPETAVVAKAPAPEVATPKATTTETAKPKATAPETAAVAKAPAPEVAAPKATTTETTKPKVTGTEATATKPSTTKDASTPKAPVASASVQKDDLSIDPETALRMDREIAELKAQLAEERIRHQGEIIHLRQGLSERVTKAELENKEAQLAAKDQQLSTLEQKFESIQARLRSIEETVKNKNAVIKALQKEVNDATSSSAENATANAKDGANTNNKEKH